MLLACRTNEAREIGRDQGGERALGKRADGWAMIRGERAEPATERLSHGCNGSGPPKTEMGWEQERDPPDMQDSRGIKTWKGIRTGEQH